MAIMKIEVEAREETGSRAVRKLRESGVIPAVLYYSGQPAIVLKFDGHKWGKLITDQLNLVNLQLPDGSNQIAAPREIQRDPLSQEVAHVDFQGIKMDDITEFHVLVTFVGSPVGVKAGGVKTINSEYVRVECLPANVPDSINVDISGLEIGDSVTAGDLVLPEGVKLLSETVSSLIRVTAIRIVEEEVEAAVVPEGEIAEEGAEKPKEGEVVEEDKKDKKDRQKR